MRATIDNEGRIPLDPEIRGPLDLKPGDEVVVENRGDELIIRAAKSETGIGCEGNVLVHRGVCTEPVDSALGRLREER